MERLTKFQRLVKEGMDDIEAGRTIPFDENFMAESLKRARKKTKDGHPIPDHLKP